MRMRQHGVAVLAVVLHLVGALPACAAGTEGALTGAPASSWQVVAEPALPVQVRGVPIDGGARAGSGMLYPTGGLGILGVAVGVLVHAGLEGAKQQGERTAAQEAADRVTEPYRPQVAEWTHMELLSAALADGVGGARSIDKGNVDPAHGLLESRPLLWITQDQRALLLENQIMVRRPGLHDEAPVPLRVTVVSAPQAAETSRENWLANRGALLKVQLVVLLRESLNAALARLAEPGTVAAPARQRTVRYLQGGEERVERAQVLAEGCGRYLLQTLRGDLLSVPQGEPDAGGCTGR